MQDFVVRQVTENDNAQIAGLMAELGYSVSSKLMVQKIQASLLSDIDSVCVAERGGQIIGVISVHILPLFHAAGNLGRITSLVVAAEYRRAGVGRLLVEAAETFARSKGCVRMEVTSGSRREAAHNFYRKAGYGQSEHGRFLKTL